MENNESLYIQNSIQIISNLTLLQKSNCYITVSFGESDESFITTILEIDKKNNTLYVDYAPKEYLSRLVLSAATVNFRAALEGILVKFETTKLTKTQHKGNPAFSLPIPKPLFWQERREYYRMKSPLSRQSFCEVTLPELEPLKLRLNDISLTGFSMLCDTPKATSLLAPGTKLEECKLSLAEVGESFISFEVRSRYLTNPQKIDPIKIYRIGCKFIRISASFEMQVQRYIQQLEREYKMKS